MKRALEWCVDFVFGMPPGWRVPLTFEVFDDAIADWDRRLAEFLRGRQ